MALKLEVGKTYERETGERWYVCAYRSTDPFKGTPRACPYFAMSEDGKIETFSEDGRYCTSGRSTLDLVREHVPPPTLMKACEKALVVLEAVRERRGLPCDMFELREYIQTAIAAEKAKVGQ